MAPRSEIPHDRRIPRGPDWRRVSRWCFLGTLVLFLWLLYPTARCSWDRFRDTPLNALEEGGSHDITQSDRERVQEAEGFFSRFGTAVELCYARTPLLGQERWKGGLLLLFAVGAVVSLFAARTWENRRRAELQ